MTADFVSETLICCSLHQSRVSALVCVGRVTEHSLPAGALCRACLIFSKKQASEPLLLHLATFMTG